MTLRTVRLLEILERGSTSAHVLGDRIELGDILSPVSEAERALVVTINRRGPAEGEQVLSLFRGQHQPRQPLPVGHTLYVLPEPILPKNDGALL